MCIRDRPEEYVGSVIEKLCSRKGEVEKMDTRTTVSYTHLDRHGGHLHQKQDKRLLRAVIFIHQPGNQGLPVAPVSYTHLDVYKRQVQYPPFPPVLPTKPAEGAMTNIYELARGLNLRCV